MKILIANWKMNGTIEFAQQFINEINTIETENIVVICPPAELLWMFSTQKYKHNLGAQNCFYEQSGAFTGEISAKSLVAFGCKYVIIGHSERRQLFNETNEIVFQKWQSAIKNNITPIVCIGESFEEKKCWQDVITNQLMIFKNENLSNTIFAYEPVWSIGKGIIPTISEISERAQFIKNIIPKKQAILYGGSVNSQNASTILKCNDINGLLIGGASLKIEEFTKIIQL